MHQQIANYNSMIENTSYVPLDHFLWLILCANAVNLTIQGYAVEVVMLAV